MFKRLTIISIFVTSAFVDAPSYYSAGAISLMGILTAAYTLLIAVLVGSRPRESWRILRRFWPLSALFLFSLLQLLRDPASAQAGQTLCLQWIFLGLIVLTMTGDQSGADEPAVARMLGYAALGASLIYFVVFIFVGFGDEGIGAISFIAARSFALFALLGIALFVSRWAGGSRTGFWLAAGMILLIALSLSRTALVVGALLFPLSRFRSLSMRDFKRLLLIGAIAVFGLYYLVVSIGALRSRFLGSNSLDDYVSGDASVDTSGRLTAWAVTINSYVESPWLGKGPGSANDAVDSVLARANLGHPLNEYLRFLHDEGLVGLVLMLGGYSQLLALCWRARRVGAEAGSPGAFFHLATFLALVAALLSMFTDNTASYVFVMGPLGIMVGTSLRSLNEKELPAKAPVPEPVTALPPPSPDALPSGIGGTI